jgi:hypothetical protein
MWDTQISALLSSPTVSQPFSRLYPSQNDVPVDTVKKNPWRQIFSTESVEKNRGFLQPKIV